MKMISKPFFKFILIPVILLIGYYSSISIIEYTSIESKSERSFIRIENQCLRNNQVFNSFKNRRSKKALSIEVRDYCREQTKLAKEAFVIEYEETQLYDLSIKSSTRFYMFDVRF